MLSLKVYAYLCYIMKFKIISILGFVAFVGKFILFICKRQCFSSYFEAHTFYFPTHFKEHTCEKCRINYFTKAIIRISTSTKDMVEGMNYKNHQ